MRHRRARRSTRTLAVMDAALRVQLGGESGGRCDCCGNETRTIWGYVHSSEQTIASYFVQWTRQAPKHFPNLDFLIGTWGDNGVNDRKLISWLYNPSAQSFMAIDSSKRPAASSPLCARALTREEVVSNASLMEQATQLIDAVWLGDPRVDEVKELAK